MNSTFQSLAPYLKDPLVLIGFFLLIAFSFSRYLIKRKVIGTLPNALGFRILRLILLYGFIIGILVIILGFALKYQELIRQQQTAASIEKMLRDAFSGVHSIAEEKKEEIIARVLEGYRNGAMSKEQIEREVKEGKYYLAYNINDSSGSTSLRSQQPTPSGNTKTEAKIENVLLPTPDKAIQPSFESKSVVAVETPTNGKVESLNTRILLSHSKPFSETASYSISQIEIHDVAPAGIENSPQIFNVKGGATIPFGIKREEVSVIIYTMSDKGGKIQLQMTGTVPNQEPRIAKWQPNNEWEIEIWLGTEKEGDPTYRVYAVAIQNFNTSESKRLRHSTHDNYSNFEQIIDVLKRERFKLLIWTQKKAQRKVLSDSENRTLARQSFKVEQGISHVSESEIKKQIERTPTEGQSGVIATSAKCEVKITAPQPGDKVGKSGRVRGTAKIPDKTYLWVLAHMKELVAEWWPQGGRPALIEPDGGWVIIAGYGMADDVNQQFEVAAVVVDVNTNTRLREWVEKGKKTNEYPPIEFPDAVAGCVPVKVIVNKTSH